MGLEESRLGIPGSEDGAHARSVLRVVVFEHRWYLAQDRPAF